ncbi:MAG TPA: acyl carrier protein [Chloroflexota bacterium]|nr:acyl carrier protein [Chloroflexota bacterium]
MDEIIEIVSREIMIPRDELSPDTRLEDIAQDSIDIMSLIAAIQSELHVSIDPADLERVVTVADLAEYVNGRRGESDSRASRRL